MICFGALAILSNLDLKDESNPIISTLFSVRFCALGIIRKTLNSFRASDSIDISLKFLIGQHVMIEGKKEPLIQLSILANGRYADTDNEIRSLAEKSQIKCLLKEMSIKLEVPLIQ